MARTPRPWLLTTENKGAIPEHFRPLVVTDRTGEFVIARLPDGLAPSDVANGRLIAAAPEMEASLAHILVLIQQSVDDSDLEAIESHCRAALAAAWGVAPDEVWTPDLADFDIADPKPAQ